MTALAVDRRRKRFGMRFRLGASGRTVLVGIYVLFGAVLSTLIAANGWQAAWRTFGVPANRSRFLDMRSLTSGWECARRGVDVLAADPCDPLHRPFNYPRVWTLGSYLGLGESATVALSLAAIAAVLAALVLVARNLSTRGALALAAVSLSPPVLLAFERGNIDLIVFALVAAGALYASSRPLISASSLASAAALKLYPIAAAAALIRRGGRIRVVGYAIVAGFVIYAAATIHDLRLINAGTPRATAYSYGAMTGPRIVRALSGGGRAVEIAVLAGSLIALAVGVFCVMRSQLEKWSKGGRRSRHLDLFVAGAAIYVATFFLGSNFEYRLIFVILTVPQLVEWAQRNRFEGRVARPVLIAAIGYVWLKHIAIAELLDWVLCGGMISLLALVTRRSSVQPTS